MSFVTMQGSLASALPNPFLKLKHNEGNNPSNMQHSSSAIATESSHHQPHPEQPPPYTETGSTHPAEKQDEMAEAARLESPRASAADLETAHPGDGTTLPVSQIGGGVTPLAFGGYGMAQEHRVADNPPPVLATPDMLYFGEGLGHHKKATLGISHVHEDKRNEHEEGRKHEGIFEKLKDGFHTGHKWDDNGRLS